MMMGGGDFMGTNPINVQAGSLGPSTWLLRLKQIMRACVNNKSKGSQNDSLKVGGFVYFVAFRC